MNISQINAESRFEVLCRSYVCAVFEVLEFHIQSDAGVQATQLFWAVGVLADHKSHYLGAWHVQDPKDAGWRAIVSDLQDRGVERLRIVIGPDPVEIRATMAPCYRDCAVLPASAALAHPLIESTLAGHRQYVERALEVANSLSLHLKRAADRHGPFADVAAAAALLRLSADRCICRDGLDPSVPVHVWRSTEPMAPTAAVN
ncbi:hypothetical protein ASC95_08735 [Pelomonas sp. Root1217]|uniref:transposase n=1 Tax=Pelomonas sp. Root1217 TaxID=1736430 RepID=UPI00070D9B22|nr:transposase [Pelomonas sp. Root1217]KQV52874.1 hypothetical protein ASC95_08735 [Pelomonas sp. Root1217]